MNDRFKELCDKNTKVIERVEYILEKYPKTRDDHRVLIKTYYLMFHGILIPERLLYGEHTPNIASVERMARKVQNSWGKYKPSDEQKEVRDQITKAHIQYQR